MKIKIQKNIDNPDFVYILVDEQAWKEVHRKLFIKNLSEVLSCKTKEALEETYERIEKKRSLNYVLWHLSRKSFFIAPIREKLEKRKISPDTITYVIAKCEEYGFLNDEKEGQQYVRSQARKGVGTYLIIEKLQHRSGWQREQVRSSVDKWLSQEDQKSMVHALIKKRYGSKDLTDPKTKQKAFNFLRRRGFPVEYILEYLP
ncbi:MAG: regulatory protein RecX [Simkaniaceae bacterium]|nr:regulatory protein RecX [Simkaniaceae bacterium]